MDAARLQQLVAETAWLRRLARSLVDDAAADDVVQETYLVAAERAPDDRPIEPWLARVARNLARMRGRSGARRSARELATGDDVDTPARPDQLVERVETQRLLTNFVLELGEPYRDVILLHFFEGLSSAAIARRLGIPDGTVRWRLKHALDDLRARFDAREDRKAWLAPMAALAHTATPVAGVLVMKKLIAIAVALILIALLTVVVIRRGDRADDVSEAAAGSSRNVTTVPSGAVPTWVVQANAPARRIAGHVVFAGTAVAGATVVLRVDAQPDVAIAEVITAADGSFAFAGPPPSAYDVIASAPGRTGAVVEINTSDPLAHPDQLVLVLGSCRARATGLVSDASSTPIAKARLRVDGLVGVDTGADGRYDLCLPRKLSTVTVGADGYGTVMAMFERDGLQHRDFMLVPEGVIVGRVVRADTQAAVSEAQVVAVSADNPIANSGATVKLTPVSTRSDGDGHFQISGLAPGRFHVSATAPGLGSALVETIVRAGATRDIVIAVSERSRVRGSVVSGGEPVPGALVSAIGAANLAQPAPVRTQPDGSFTLDGAPRGVVTWRVRGYDVASPTSTTIDKPELTDVVLDVHKGASIHGVVTLRGAPVRDAEVMWHNTDLTHGWRFHDRTTRTDANGIYMFDDIVPGRCRVIADDDEGYSEDHMVDVAAGQTTQLDIELVQTASVSGTVVDDTGAPAPSVAVLLFDPHYDSDQSYHAAPVITDATGAWRVPQMPAGDYLPRVFPEHNLQSGAYAPVTGTAFSSIHVPDMSTITGVVLAIRMEKLTIRGTVVDDRGTPLPDVRVEIEQAAGAYDPEASNLRFALLPLTMQPNPGVVTSLPSTITDASGSFALRDLVRGRYALLASGADGGATTLANVEAGSASVTITLPRSGSIDGTLVGFGPAPSVMASDSTDNLRTAAVDGTHFTITGLRPGNYAVTAKDAAGAEVRSVTITAGSTAHVELHAGGTGRIEGRYTDFASGEPVPSTYCMASPGTNGFASWWNFDAAVMTDAAGHFAIDPAPAGRTRVICMGESRSQRDVIVPAGGTAQVQLVHVKLDAKGGNAGFTMLEDQNPPTVDLIQPKGAAATAGLLVGDQIAYVDGISVDPFGVDGVAALVASHAPATTVVLGVIRGGPRLNIAIVLR